MRSNELKIWIENIIQKRFLEFRETTDIGLNINKQLEEDGMPFKEKFGLTEKYVLTFRSS